MPPSTKISLPLMYELSDDARNNATDAISSERPTRPSGMPWGHLLVHRLGRFLAADDLGRDGCVNGAGADDVDAHVASLQVEDPATREAAHRRLRARVHARRGDALGTGDGGVQDDRRARGEQRERLLHGEEQTFDVCVEQQVEVLLGRPGPAGRTRRCPRWRRPRPRRPFSDLIVANSRSRSARLDTSPWTAVTLLPTRAAASSSSFWRRPVMKTCAPSATKRCAVTRPMPLLPPVMRAIFPSSLLEVVLIIFCIVRYIYKRWSSGVKRIIVPRGMKAEKSACSLGRPRSVRRRHGARPGLAGVLAQGLRGGFIVGPDGGHGDQSAEPVRRLWQQGIALSQGVGALRLSRCRRDAVRHERTDGPRGGGAAPAHGGGGFRVPGQPARLPRW